MILAKELVDKFKKITVQYVLNGEANEADVLDEAKECALLAVDEIIEANPVEWTKQDNVLDKETGELCTQYTCASTRKKWLKLKEEIKKL